MFDDKIIQLAVNTIRTLSIDAVQAAKSGHPGTPMALAPLVYTLWNRVMNFDPQDPIWTRDEYPFAATREGGSGAWVGHVPAGLNSWQGGTLIQFIQRYGILPGEQFDVEVVNHPNAA